MKRSRFVLQYPPLLPMLRKVLTHSGLDYADISDVVSSVTSRILREKTYLKIEAAKLRGFLVTAIKLGAKECQRNHNRRQKRFKRLPDDGEDSMLVETALTETEAMECPFCHKGVLNMFGACAECHTILPSSAHVRRTVLRMDEVSLAVDFQYDRKLDVAKAIARLSEREQTVVKACAMGQESLASLSQITGLSGPTLWRAWCDAKAKLQYFLSEYASEHVSKHTPVQFQRALDAATRAGLRVMK